VTYVNQVDGKKGTGLRVDHTEISTCLLQLITMGSKKERILRACVRSTETASHYAMVSPTQRRFHTLTELISVAWLRDSDKACKFWIVHSADSPRPGITCAVLHCCGVLYREQLSDHTCMVGIMRYPTSF
jgi:hypothetical protein